MYKNFIKQQIGFTLAEVLLTITIIGIIATYTIPGLLMNIQDTQLHIKWKKQYNTADQSAKMLAANNETIVLSGSSGGIRDTFASVINVVKSDVWANVQGGIPYNYYKNPSAYSVWVPPNYASFQTVDGAIWGFWMPGIGCGAWNRNCVKINVDVNGIKPPNMAGKDLFSLWIVEEAIGVYAAHPGGTEKIGTYTCVPNSTTMQSSDGCSRLALIKDAADMP